MFEYHVITYLYCTVQGECCLCVLWHNATTTLDDTRVYIGGMIAYVGGMIVYVGGMIMLVVCLCRLMVCLCDWCLCARMFMVGPCVFFVGLYYAPKHVNSISAFV